MQVRRTQTITLGIAAVSASLVTMTLGAAHAKADTTPSGGIATSNVGVTAVYEMETNDDNPGGRVEFNTNGDVIAVYDEQSGDGYAAIASVFAMNPDGTRGDRIYSLRDGGGDDGIPATRRDSDDRLYNLPEGRTFYFRVCLISGDGPFLFCDYAQWLNTDS